MKIKTLIEELYKEISRGDIRDETILVEHDKKLYDFDLGIDVNGYPLIVITKEFKD